ncbi:MAG: ABC transporter ATP-binding protein/permease [Candidatus Nealsonbacteria bacterium DGGOD1a]|nr:MAG: ABC transporter ATP-binding protein/permease [Candidatus Nealsonbacteria bacterium DGGOD1a]
MNDYPEVTTKMVLAEFWKGVKPHKRLFWGSLICFSISFAINVFVPIFYKDFFDTLESFSDKNESTPILIRIISIIALLHSINWVFGRISVLMANRLEAKVSSLLKQNSFNYLILHSRNFFANNFSGSLVQKINRFSRSFIRIADAAFFEFLQLLITGIGAIIITSFISPMISLIITGWIIIFAAFNILFQVRVKIKYDIAAAAADSKTTGLLADNITNYSPISLFNGYKRESALLKETVNDQARKLCFSWDLWIVINAIQIALTYTIEFFIFYYGIIFWRQDLITAGTFVLMQIYIIGIAQQFWGLNRTVREVYESIADSKEMVEIMALPHEIKDVAAAKELKDVEGGIEFKEVNFSFNETRSVLKDINLVISAGEKVALVGPSGTGKTTFTGLLLRLFDPAGGAIFIDGQNIHNVTLESLRASISLVPQDPVLFHRTIMENIRYGKPQATDKEVITAAKLAHCDEFVDSMPLKYETLVGERGVKLSGGERQRVAIARAILKNAPILVLDEATSSLDSQSEMLIQDALDKLMSRCTTIAIAHRLSTIRKMDRIIVMDNGTIIEQGTHQGLIRRKGGIYKNLWSLQAGGFIE